MVAVTRILGVSVVFGIIALAGACGSSGSSSGSSAAPPASEPNNRTVASGVNGPLDAAQTPISEELFGQLASAAAGTPLAVTLDCAHQAIVIDAIDVLDSIALALANAAESQDPAAFESASGNIQFSLNELANDLPGALGAVTGDDCNSSNGGSTGGNPLAGTPLEPLGDALAPVLEQFPSGGGGSADSDLSSLALLTNQLAGAFRSGLAQVPAEVRSAPFIGGTLLTLDTALTDLSVTLNWFAVYNGQMTAITLENTLNRLLVNTLTNVIPVNFIEAQAGQEGVLSGPISDGVDQATAGLGDNLLSVALPLVADTLNVQLAPVLDPVENTVLPAILLAAFSGVDGGGTDPISLLLGQITDNLTGDGSSSPTGTSVDLILGPLLDLTADSSECPLAETLLASACSLYTLL